MKKRSKLGNISLKTDVDKLNKYIDQQNKLICGFSCFIPVYNVLTLYII